MSENTKIEWADHTWSPWRGCTKVSPGCANCYAEKLSLRNPSVLGEFGKGRPRVKAKNWHDPARWNAREAVKLVPHAEFVVADRPKVFPSLCDWLDDEVPIEWLAEFLQLIHDTPNLTWLLLTKRPHLWSDRLRAVHRVAFGREDLTGAANQADSWWGYQRPPANVWFGVSVEDQERADERVPALLKIPAKVRWLSIEPLIGPVNLEQSIGRKEACPRCTPPTDPGCPYCLGTGGLPMLHSGLIHWLVIGGESGGRKARPCDLQWIRFLRDQGIGAGVPVFVKQLGANPHCECGELPNDGTSVWHPKGGDQSQWPEDLRVRQFPR